MNPSNRFAMRLVHMLRTRYRRCTAVVTCLMAEALDVQSLHIPLKVNMCKSDYHNKLFTYNTLLI